MLKLCLNFVLLHIATLLTNSFALKGTLKAFCFQLRFLHIFELGWQTGHAL